MPALLVIDEPHEQVEQWRGALERAGYRLVAEDDASAPPDVIVLGAPSAECRAWELLPALRRTESGLAGVPVVVVVGPGALEDGLRGAIEGAVRCLAKPVSPAVLTGALDAVLAPDAPAAPEQHRRSRQRALEVLARIEARGAASGDEELHPRLVHLTRLEHGPVRSSAPDPVADARSRLAMLTPKQRSLLETVAAEGGVTAAAARLETSRGNLYAGLRRIVHRLGVRNTAELLRILGSGELLRSARV